MTLPSEQEAAEFAKRVDTTGDCWMWLGPKNREGYGAFYYNGKTTRAHRMAMMLTGRHIEDGMYVCHICDNPGCVNPDHLFIGTQKANIRDSINKGRFRFVDKSLITGERNGKAVLSDDEVAEIRRRYKEGDVTQQELADEYKVSRPHISNLVREKGFVRKCK